MAKQTVNESASVTLPMSTSSGFVDGRRRRQRSEQYFTSSQQSAHFLRQAKGRPHTGQILVGRSDFDRDFAIGC